uniref:Dedicator of cytokinesis protein 1 n=1 Tax=Branchiostoma floridae TaxID=7739 RepID=C3Y5V8_BRAFL|eukprot:XP_002608345.1 hypothetical protein BRAFLDRAFT_91300 [Branchiostoma floridae]
MTRWVPTTTRKYAVAIYNYHGNGETKLDLTVGDTLHILEENDGWFRGFKLRNKSVKGIFPTSYVHIKQAMVENAGKYNETVAPKEPKVVQEMTTVLREWGVIWKQLYVDRGNDPSSVPKAGKRHSMDLFDTVRKMMYEMIDWRRQIMSGTLPVDELKELQQLVTSKIDFGNRLLGLDLVVRDEQGGILDPETTGTISLYRAHETATERIQREKSMQGVQRSSQTQATSHNLYVVVKNFVCRVGEDADVFMALYDAKENRFIRVSGDNDFLEGVIKKVVSARGELNHKGQGLWVSMKMLDGDIKQVRKEYPHLVDGRTAVARKMGFPEVIMPGDVRNDMYVTLVSGEFDRGTKARNKNVEVTMCVCKDDGSVVQNVIFTGAGVPPVSEYKSVIYYQQKQPRWMETIKVAIPIEDFYGSHLKFAFRHSKLMVVLKYYIDNANERDNHESLLKAMKSLQYIFKFIVRSRVLYSQLYEGKGKQQFEAAVRHLFQSLNGMMTYTSDSTVGVQGAALRYVPTVIPDVITVFDPKELSLLLKDFINNIPPDRLVKQKVQCMNNIVHSDLFRLSECRGILLPMMMAQLKKLIERKEEMPDCVKMLSDVLDRLNRKDVGPIHGDMEIVMKEILRTVIQTVIFMDRDAPLIGSFVACMTGILRQMNEFHYQAYIDAFPSRSDLLLWNNFFHLAVSFLTQESLQLENFSHAKRMKIINKYQDMRRVIGFEILSMWFNLGQHKIKFIPEMVGPMLEMTLIPETKLREHTIPIFFDMMQCEFATRGNFNQVENEIITQLDHLVEGGRGDDQYKELFYRIYLYKLCDLHLECDNYTEAAYTLLLHATLLKWTDEPLITTHDKYPEAQTHRQLKEMLYYDIIEYFDKGKMWEEGIRLCKELASQYENETFDFLNLSLILQKQAMFYDNIMKTMRPDPEYFRVGYFGQGYPSFLRNKVFIYRGKEYERLGDFTSRLLSQFPHAQPINKVTAPGPEILESPSQHLQIFKVDPILEERREFRGKPVADQILNFYKVNEVQKFTFSRPIRKGDRDSDNEFANMFLERTNYVTAYKLPGILRWFEVTSTNTFEVSPLENACEIMENSNTELRHLIEQQRADPTLTVNTLSLRLNGIIDAAVMGGTANYEKAFFTEEYMASHPEDHARIERLKDLIACQIPLLEAGLKVHAQKAPDSLRKLQEKMDSLFVDMKTRVESEYGKKPPMDETTRSRPMSLVWITRNKPVDRPVSTISTSSTSSDGLINSKDRPSTPETGLGPPQLPQKSVRHSSQQQGKSSPVKTWVSKTREAAAVDGPVVELKETLKPARPMRPVSQPRISLTKQNGVPGPATPPPKVNRDVNRSASPAASVSSTIEASPAYETCQSATDFSYKAERCAGPSHPSSKGESGCEPVCKSCCKCVFDNDVPPPLPEKKAYADYGNIAEDEDEQGLPPPLRVSSLPKSKSKPVPPLPIKEGVDPSQTPPLPKKPSRHPSGQQQQ